MKWTEDQAAAIDSRGENLLLSAAAGSGKTAVLVERVAKLLLEGADIERMLIVTFTRASAADMKEHLIARLQSLADGGDARLREQAERVDRASISTIHAFCTDFLRAISRRARSIRPFASRTARRWPYCARRRFRRRCAAITRRWTRISKRSRPFAGRRRCTTWRLPCTPS